MERGYGNALTASAALTNERNEMRSAIDWKVNDILNPVGKAFYELATAIEKLPTSDDQSTCQIKRQEVEWVVSRLLDAIAVMREGLETVSGCVCAGCRDEEIAREALARADQLLAGDAEQGGGG